MQNAKRKVQSVGTALQLYMIGHSEECNNEESLLVLLFTLNGQTRVRVSGGHLCEAEAPTEQAGEICLSLRVATLRMTMQAWKPATTRYSSPR